MALDPAQQALLARLDERSAWIVDAMKADKAEWTKQLDELSAKIDAHKSEAKAEFVPKSRILMLEKVVYGGIGTVLLGVLGTVLSKIGIAGN